MTTILVIGGFLLVGILGFLIMDQVDRFLDRYTEAEEEREDEDEPEDGGKK